MKTVKVKGPACPATARISKWSLGHSHGFSLEFMEIIGINIKIKLADSPRCSHELLGQFLVWNLRWLRDKRQEMLLAPVSAHTHTLGQAGNIWAAVPPPHWSVGAASNTPSSAGSSEIIIEQRLSNKVSNQRLSIGADPGLRAGAALYKISLRWMVPLGHNSKDILNLIPLTRVTWPTICHKGLKFEILYSLREMMRSLVYFSLRSPLSNFWETGWRLEITFYTNLHNKVHISNHIQAKLTVLVSLGDTSFKFPFEYWHLSIWFIWLTPSPFSVLRSIDSKIWNNFNLTLFFIKYSMSVSSN